MDNLILIETDYCNVDFICTIFNMENQLLIQKIPLSMNHIGYGWISLHDHKGIYTIENGYKDCTTSIALLILQPLAVYGGKCRGYKFYIKRKILYAMQFIIATQ